jgi:hypothetical protein
MLRAARAGIVFVVAAVAALLSQAPNGTSAGSAQIVEEGHLTQLAKRDGGVFVPTKIQRIVGGHDVASHGSPEMPI